MGAPRLRATSSPLVSDESAQMASRLAIKMQEALDSGAYYEAAELCKAMATRSASKKDTAAAAALLSAGAAAQIAAGAAAGGVQRGIELAVQLVDLFRKAKLPADATNVGALSFAAWLSRASASDACRDAATGRVLEVLQACPRERLQAGAAGVGSLGLSTDSAAIATWMGSALQWAHADDSGAR